jgi:hypothetical protein
MRLAYVIILFLSILSSCDTESSFPIPEDNYFVKFYGNEGDQEGVDFILNSDGSVVMVGNSKTVNDQQLIYAVKVDAQGAVLWQHYYGTSLPGDKTAKDIELHSDGRIIIVGEFAKGVTDSDVYLFSINADGLLQDSVIVGLNKNGIETDEHVNSVSIISNGFIVTGSTTKVETNDVGDVRDALHLRFDNSLNEIPQAGPITWGPRNYGFNSDDVAVKVLEIGVNNFYVFGYSNRIFPPYNGDYNFWIYSLSGNGVPINADLYAGKTSEDEKLTSVEVSPLQSGQGYILSGTATRSSGETQSYLVKLSSTLTFQPTDILIETNPTDMGTDVGGNLATKSLLTQEFMLLTNDNTPADKNTNLALTKLTRELTKAWQIPLVFGGESDDFAGSVTELPDGRILVVGTMTVGGLSGQKKMVLMKLNAEGKLTK